MRGHDNPRLIEAEAWLDGRDGGRFRVVAGTQVVLAEQVMLDTGTSSRMTLLTDAGQLIPREDSDTAAALLQAFADEGIAVHLNAQVVRVAHDADSVTLHLAAGSVVAGSDLFVATGRVPNWCVRWWRS